jgi:protein-disulfide isomerase
MAKILETAATAGVLLAALTIGATAIHREFGSPAPAPTDRVARAPTKFPRWADVQRLGRWIGDSAAPVKIVVFSDYECPYCKRFFERFEDTEKALPGVVALLMIPRPLSMHRFAMPAETAAECAAGAGKFREYTAALFKHQDSLGLKSWNSFATDAGISDTLEFGRCVRRPTSASIRLAVAVADSLEFRSTPTVIINGWRYYAPPTELDSLVKAFRNEALKSR